MTEEHKKEVDHISGIETTGHEWDGLKELNNPLPRWWVWVWLVCIIWAVWYWVVYPTWPIPGGHTEGSFGYTQYDELAKSQQEIAVRQAAYLDSFNKASFDEVMNDPALLEFALAGGHAAFKDNCAVCHGTGAEGGKGYPNLNDDDWLWGGTLSDIYTTLQHGIRAEDDEDTRMSQMPSFGKDEILSRDEINQVVDYVLSFSNGGASEQMPGYAIFQDNCASCHGEDGKGGRDFGAPNLTDNIWLYGGDRETVFETVYNARYGIMPSWNERLSDDTIRQLAIYIHQLGGGESDEVVAVAKEIPEPVVEVEDKPVQAEMEAVLEESAPEAYISGEGESVPQPEEE